jgi:hypothetical protein
MKRSMMILSVSSLVLSNSGISGGESPWWSNLPVSKEKPWWASRARAQKEVVTEKAPEVEAPVAEAPVAELPVLDTVVTGAPVVVSEPVVESPVVPELVVESPVVPELVVESPAKDSTSPQASTNYTYQLPVLMDEPVSRSESSSAIFTEKPSKALAPEPKAHEPVVIEKRSQKVSKEPVSEPSSAPRFDFFHLVRKLQGQQSSTMKVDLITSSTDTVISEEKPEASLIPSKKISRSRSTGVKNPFRSLISKIKKMDLSESLRRKSSWFKVDRRRKVEPSVDPLADNVIVKVSQSQPEVVTEEPMTLSMKKTMVIVPVFEPEVSAERNPSASMVPREPMASTPVVAHVADEEVRTGASASMVPREPESIMKPEALATKNSVPKAGAMVEIPVIKESRLPIAQFIAPKSPELKVVSQPVVEKRQPVAAKTVPVMAQAKPVRDEVKLTVPKTDLVESLKKTFVMPKAMWKTSEPVVAKKIISRKDKVDSKWGFEVDRGMTMTNETISNVASDTSRRSKSLSNDGYLLMTLVKR